MDKRGILVVIFLVFLTLFLGLYFDSPTITGFAVEDFETSAEERYLPVVSDGKEKVDLDYKYANSSGVIMSTKPSVTCYLKPDHLNDGWRDCEAIFEVENMKSVKAVIEDPTFLLDFENCKKY